MAAALAAAAACVCWAGMAFVLQVCLSLGTERTSRCQPLSMGPGATRVERRFPFQQLTCKRIGHLSKCE